MVKGKPRGNSVLRDKYRVLAMVECLDKVNVIVEKDAPVKLEEGGAWVQSWVWVIKRSLPKD